MALRGSLRDFSLPDVLQLIGLSRKTGVLRIAGQHGATGSIWLRDGEVFFAQSNWQRTKLGERLVAAQKITPSALARVLTVHATDPQGRRIGQIFVDEGYITQSVLEAFVQEQIQDTIFDLMRWEDGDFGFDPLPEELDEDIGLSVSIENIIMEGSRRLEEWQRLKSVIPSMDIVFGMSAAPGLSGFEISLKPVEWNLLMLIDGTRSVADLARKTGQTDFEVARVIHGLFSAGLLEVAPYVETPQEPEHEAEIAADAAEQAQVQPAASMGAVEAELVGPAEAAPDEEASGEPLVAGIEPAADAAPAAFATGVQEPASIVLPSAEPTEEEIIEEILYARHTGRIVQETEITEAYADESAAVPEAAVAADAGALTESEDGTERGAGAAPAERPHADEDNQVAEEEWARASVEIAEPEPAAGAPPEAADRGEAEARLTTSEVESAGPAEAEVPFVAPQGRVMDVGLGSAISDEITALTGAARSVRATAASDRAPGDAGAALQRDVSVDRETVLKIIHAVEKL